MNLDELLENQPKISSIMYNIVLLDYLNSRFSIDLNQACATSGYQYQYLESSGVTHMTAYHTALTTSTHLSLSDGV